MSPSQPILGCSGFIGAPGHAGADAVSDGGRIGNFTDRFRRRGNPGGGLQTSTKAKSSFFFLVRNFIFLHVVLTGIFANFNFVVGKAGFFGLWTWPLVSVGQILVALVFADLAGAFLLQGARITGISAKPSNDRLVRGMDGAVCVCDRCGSCIGYYLSHRSIVSRRASLMREWHRTWGEQLF